MTQELTPVRVVLVTGSSGFLGQHVVKELHEEEHATIREIRLFDNRPYENRIGFHVSKPKETKEYVGDICNAAELSAALSGVDAVIHCASIVDPRFFADSKVMERVNVQGTSNVVECCVAQGVPHLVYASTVGATPLVRRSRLDLPFPEYVGPYGETKARAEDIVVTSNGRLLSRERGRLRTLPIRIPPLYGELDQIFITKCLRISRLTFDFAFCLECRVQSMYAGNAASLALRGIDALAAPGSSDVSGKSLYATDETTDDISLVLRPIAEARGIRLFPLKVPSGLVLAISCAFWGLAVLLSPLVKLNSEAVPSPMEIVFMRRCPPYDGNEAAEKLHWKPKYSVRQAISASLDYYRNVKL
ncbi:3 beta-hydroxysteroid dehydrogenase type 7 [Rhipicephalus sanguineus]|uniref:3 beta-hydroxysteroid dehydrogenase type 7 n=1 Tax=Rhipicephalus sanguineus TaxID=34632 RepID=UPI001895B536|nr:3 beta-hydroxysteroid dehydrogenase type 7 [Rhipicephalus sanguineus]XP_037502908.1 3 beta-hydroxysteroid dehydrogenase type 7 [Rhipicephalus sanguineus]